jgi:hypothetical protein
MELDKIDMKIDYPNFLRFSCIVNLYVAFTWALCGIYMAFAILSDLNFQK